MRYIEELVNKSSTEREDPSRSLQFTARPSTFSAVMGGTRVPGGRPSASPVETPSESPNPRTSRCSKASTRKRSRPWARSRCTKLQATSPASATAESPTVETINSAPLGRAKKSGRLGGGAPRSASSTVRAMAASTMLRASVRQLTIPEVSWPKQRHSTRRPRAIAVAMVIENATSKRNAAAAPARADATGGRVAATISSAIGTPMLSGAASQKGQPKSSSDRRVPERSANFATPAARKTTASPTRPSIVSAPTDIVGAITNINFFGEAIFRTYPTSG